MVLDPLGSWNYCFRVGPDAKIKVLRFRARTETTMKKYLKMDPKTTPKRSGWPTNWRNKKQPISGPLFLAKKTKNVNKTVSKMCLKRWLYFRGGASWCTFGAPSWFLIQKVNPQRPPKCPRDRKKAQKWTHGTPKVTPRTEKYSKNDPQSAPERGLSNCTADLHIWPGGLREALWINMNRHTSIS